MQTLIWAEPRNLGWIDVPSIVIPADEIDEPYYLEASFANSDNDPHNYPMTHGSVYLPKPGAWWIKAQNLSPYPHSTGMRVSILDAASREGQAFLERQILNPEFGSKFLVDDSGLLLLIPNYRRRSLFVQNVTRDFLLQPEDDISVTIMENTLRAYDEGWNLPGFGSNLSIAESNKDEMPIGSIWARTAPGQTAEVYIREGR